MKRLLFIVVLWSLFLPVSAQQGAIVYHDPITLNGINFERPLDFDLDSVTDLCVTLNNFNNEYSLAFAITNHFYDYNLGYHTSTSWFVKPLHIGDTISEVDGFNGWEYNEFFDDEVYSVDSLYLGFRHQNENGYYYGWIRYSYRVSVNNPSNCRVVFDYVYCTIPDYPLRVGQTSFNWDLAEQESSADPVIQPNPTSGVFTLSCENLCQIDIYNAMGQHIVTRRASEDSIALDLGNQPSGVYFVSIIAQEGKRCVKKVVKQ